MDNSSADTTLPKTPTRGKWPTATRLFDLLVGVVIGYRGEKLALRAGNLTFITLTSLVPLAAVVLALVHSFGSGEVELRVTTFFRDILNPGGRERAEEFLAAFKTAADSPTGSSLSFLVLLVSSGVMLRHLDASLNDVWAVRRRRPIVSTLGLYLGVLFIGPVAMAVSLLGSERMKRLLVWAEFPAPTAAYALGSLLSAVVVFSLLYKIAPHAHVPWKSALLGGAVAGLAWELSRRLYGTVASLFVTANVVYGALGNAPLFLTWVYSSWYIVLSGARLAYAIEHADFHDEFRELLVHPRCEELIATRVAQLIARARMAHVPGPTPLGLAAQLNMPTQRVEESIARLLRAGLVVAQNSFLVPAKELTVLTVADISEAVGGAAKFGHRRRLRTGQFDQAAGLFGEADDVSIEKLKKITWEDLARLPEGERKG